MEHLYEDRLSVAADAPGDVMTRGPGGRPGPLEAEQRVAVDAPAAEVAWGVPTAVLEAEQRVAVDAPGDFTTR